jgi:hypothetical protein
VQWEVDSARRRRNLLVAAGAGLLLALILLFVLLAARDNDDPSAVGYPTPTPAPTPTAAGGTPTAAPTGSDGAPASQPAGDGLAEFQSKCRESVGALTPARVVYDTRMTMTLGKASTVTALVTFDHELAPSALLPEATRATGEAIKVTCHVEARLGGLASDFDVDPVDWQTRWFDDRESVTWRWAVKPKVSGEILVLLHLRPVVRVPGRGDVSAAQDEETATEAFVAVVKVEKPVGMSLEAGWNWTVQHLESLFAALVAVGGILAFFKGRWPRRRKRPDDDADGPVVTDPARMIEELRRVRVERGVDPDRMAEALTLPRPAFDALESGARVATFRNVHDYADALGLDLALRPRRDADTGENPGEPLS